MSASSPIIRLFAAGVPPEAIAKQLQISRGTVGFELLKLSPDQQLAGLHAQLEAMADPLGPRTRK